MSLVRCASGSRHHRIVAPGGLASGTAYDAVVDADGPDSQWKLGDTSGTVAADRNAVRAGTYVGSPTLNVTALAANNLGDRSVRFNGTNGRVTTTRSAALDFTGTVPFSIEAWVKIEGWDTNLRRIAGQEVAATGWCIAVLNSVTYPKAVRFERRISGVATMAQVTGLALGVSYHVVGVYTGSVMQIYINGVQTVGDADVRSMTSHAGFFCISDRSDTA